MLPTLPIPVAARAESPMSAQANAPDAQSDGDGFACALQRAQGAPTAAVGAPHDARAMPPHGGEPHGKNAPSTEGKPGVRAGGRGHDVDRPRVGDHGRHDDKDDDAHTIDPKALTAPGEQPAAETTSAALPGAPSDDGDAPTWPPIAIDAVLPPRSAHDVARGTTVAVQPADADDALAATTSLERRALASSRHTVGTGAHEARTLTPDAATPATDAARGEPLATSTTPRGDELRTGIDTTTAAIAAVRTPIGERATADAVAVAATSMAASNATDATQGRDKIAGPAHEATLRAAIDDAGFDSALGGQVSLWVREGVQEARLHLHPAELGPVNVQIALDGQLAHIDFIAAVAATRESIEQSLPALAAALRESGFTLAGGGVSGQGTHGGQNGQRGDGREFGTRHDGGDDSVTPAAAPWRRSRSLLDVYA